MSVARREGLARPLQGWRRGLGVKGSTKWLTCKGGLGTRLVWGKGAWRWGAWKSQGARVCMGQPA